MSTKKKNDNYMTVDEILEKRREQRLKGFATDNGNNYQTADEIIEAGYKQGIWKRPEPMEQPSTQNMSGRQNLIGKDDVTRYGTDFRLWKQNQRTKNETLPNITQNAISDFAKEYKENPLGYDYISRYDSNTPYSEVSDDIDKLEGLKGGAARRGKDTSVYDLALEKLKSYASSRYDTNNPNTTVDDKKALYDDNKREINKLHGQLDALREKKSYNELRLLNPDGTVNDASKDAEEKELENRIGELSSRNKAIETQLNNDSSRNKTVEELQKEIDSPQKTMSDIDLNDEATVSKYLNHDREAVDFFMNYRRNNAGHDPETEARYQNLLNTIEAKVNATNEANSRYNTGEEIGFTDSHGRKYNKQDYLIQRVAQNRINDITADADTAKSTLEELSAGNRNLTNSTVINRDDLNKFGWEVDGDTINFGQAYSSATHDNAAVFSPVVYNENGEVERILTPYELEQYANNVLAGAKDSLGLKMTDTYYGSNSESLANENQKRIRRLSERYYNNSDLQSLIDRATINEGENETLHNELAQANGELTTDEARKQLEALGVDADEIVEYQKLQDQKQRSRKWSEAYSEWSAGGVPQAAIATTGNIVASPVQALEWMGNLGESLIDHFKAGTNELSVSNLPNIDDDLVTNLSDASTSAITEAIRENIKGDGDNDFLNEIGDLAANTYGGVTSGIQSAATVATCYALLPRGIAEAASLAIMAGEAGNQAYHDTIENGGTVGQAVTYSVASAANEVIGEKLSVENLFSIIQTSGKQTAKEILESTLKQSAFEMSEEVVTEGLNEFADRIVNGDQATYYQALQQYLDMGYSEEEAKNKASSDFYDRVLSAAYGGFVGGLVGGGMTSIGTKMQNAHRAWSAGQSITDSDNIQNLLNQAQEFKDNDSVRQLAEEVAELNSKQGKSNRFNNWRNDIKTAKSAGNLFQEIQEANAQKLKTARENEIKDAIKSAYSQNTGEDINSDSVRIAADTIYDSIYSDKQLTEEQEKLLSSETAQSTIRTVLNSLDIIDSNVAKAQKRYFQDYLKNQELTNKSEPKSDADVDIDEFNTHEDDGKIYTEDGSEQFNIDKNNPIASVGSEGINLRSVNGQTENARNLSIPTSDAVLIKSIEDIQDKTVKDSLGVDITPEIANTLYQGYHSLNNDMSVSAYMQEAKTVLYNGYIKNTAIDNSLTIPQSLRNKLYSQGANLRNTHTESQQEEVISRVKGNNAKQGNVSFRDGMTVGKGKRVYVNDNGKTSYIGDFRQAGIDTVSALAESLGFDVVFYRSTKDGKGRFSSDYVTNHKFVQKGKQAPSGFWRGGKMYIDVNAGMSGEGLILFTASHELVHMMKEGSPEDFKAFSDFIVQNYAEQGVDINDLIRAEMARSTNLSRDEAFEEVIADSAESFFRDTNLNGKAKEFYRQNPSAWERIRRALKRIIDAIKETYFAAKSQSDAGRITARSDIKQLEQAYDLWVKGIIKSAENLRNMSGKKSQSIKNTFAGREALTADVATLEEAKRLEDEGVDSEDIRQQTGWNKGMDGKWRFEIDDSDMTINITDKNSYFLNEFVNHKPLFDAYPALNDVIVEFLDLPGGQRGQFDGYFNRIAIRKNLKDDPEAVADILVHEIQHVVQDIEGFASGASPSYWQSVINKNRPRRTKNEQDMMNRAFDELTVAREEESREFTREVEQLYDSAPDTPRGKVDWNTLEQIEPDPPEWKEFDKKVDELEKKYGENRLWKYWGIYERADLASKNKGSNNAIELYNRTGGEIEARDSSDRRILTSEQRKNKRPNIDSKDVVFAKYQSRVDSDYLSAVERGDMDTAQKMVNEAAKEAGYNTPMLYHGTQKFGFTEFDLNKLDDKLSIFLTSTEETASTYSGVNGVRRIGEKNALDRRVDDLSPKELVEAVNRYKGASQFDVEYKYYSLDDINKMVDSTGESLKQLKQFANEVLPAYEKVGTKQSRYTEQSIYVVDNIKELIANIDNNDYIWVASYLKTLSEQAKEFNTKEYERLYDTLHLLGTIRSAGIYDDYVIISDVGDGMFYQSMREQTLRDMLKNESNYGNYSIYAKLDNPLVIDADGANWNRIPVSEDIWFELSRLDRDIDREGNTTSYTRAISAYAKDKGYDGVIFKSLNDNGGENDYVHRAESDVYVVFDSTQVKSADPVTYDNDGNVIPLSERFNTTNTDIRYMDDRNGDLFFDVEIGDSDSIQDNFVREYESHYEDIGEVLKNISDIDIAPSKVSSVVNRVLRENYGNIDKGTRELLSTEIQIALDQVNRTDPATVMNTITDAVRDVIADAYVVNEKAEADYQDLLSVFKGKKFYLSDEQIADLKEHKKSLKEFKDKMFGYRITIANKDNLERSINGGYKNAQQLSLEGLHDILESPDDYLGFRADQWDEMNYHAPIIIEDALDDLKKMRKQRMSEVYSTNSIDEDAVSITAQITGGIVEAKYNNKKNPYITKLVDDLKAKRSEAVKKQKEKNKKKLAELKQKERERAEKREQDLRKEYQEQRDRNRESRKRTEFRDKIKRIADSFNKRLTAPKSKQYIPQEFIKQTLDVLNSVAFKGKRGVAISSTIADLRQQYNELHDSEYYSAYTLVVETKLSSIGSQVKQEAKEWAPKRNKAIEQENKRLKKQGKPLKPFVTEADFNVNNMSLELLDLVYDCFKSMDYVIRESVKMTDTNFKQDAHQLGREWMAEIIKVPKEHLGILSGYVQTMLSAERFFNRIAGFKKNSVSSQLFDMLNKGQLKMTQLEMEFTQTFDDLINNKQIKSLFDTKKMVDIGLVDEDGEKVHITRGMMLSLYMHLLNEDNARHVMNGGLTVPNMKDYYKGDMAKAYGNGMQSVRVGEIDYSKYSEGLKTVIEKHLSEYEIEWINAAHKFFDVQSRNALNEATLKLYGFKRANVDNYFPIHTDKNYRAANFENIIKDMSLENSGFMKERIKASNPILLEDIVDVINTQISHVSKYCGMTMPIRNFQKVYGTTTVGFETSVQKELNKKFSSTSKNAGATKYIDNLITDLSSGRGENEGAIAQVAAKARGNLAQATLTLNPRVAIAQTASLVTASPVIGNKAIRKALVSDYFKVSDEEIAEITPLFWLRRQGYANTEIGDIRKLRNQKHKIQGKFEKALNWINAMDSWAVRRLFVACKFYMQDNYKNLKPGTDEYKMKLSEVYNKVIETTQPNYTTLQRPDILRNPNALVKSLTMFMTQRLQNFNIVYDAIGTYKRYRLDFKNGVNGVTAEDVKQARAKRNSAIVSQVASAATIVGMKLFADVLLHSMFGYRDKDDELTAESVSLSLLDGFADTIFGNILFGSDLYKLVMGSIKGDNYEGVSLSGVDTAKDFLTNFSKLLSNTIKSAKGESSFNIANVKKIGETVCLLCGIPLKNAEKIGKAIYYWTSDISNGTFMESGVNRSLKQNINRYESKYYTDEEEAKKLLMDMINEKVKDGTSEKDAKQNIKRGFTSAYKQRYIDAVRNNNTEEIKSIRKILLSTGLYGSLSEQDKAMKKWLDKAE